MLLCTPLIYNELGKRINNSGNIIIGEHVWVAVNATLLKNISVGASSIIRTHSVVTKSIDNQTINIGISSKTVKSKVLCTRENVVNT